MINCSRFFPTTEETRSWQPNNKSTRGLTSNARTVLGRTLQTCSERTKPRPSTPPTGTLQSLSFHSKEQASLERLSHWDSAIALVPFKGISLAKTPLPRGLDDRSCSIQRNKPRSSAPPIGTLQSLSFHSKEQASLERLSHGDSAIALVPFKGTSLAPAPLPLGLGDRSKRLSHWDSAIALVPFKGTSLAQAPLPLGLSDRSCSIQRNKPRSSTSPIGIRQ
ncbi:hypothetical protein Adt_01623 [Abeliophyllum distichum]|uniref:Uncharacterized protein n=1 Tax=Abeliophyllum distichum TaxID=126358 RepID=A0ABD1VTD1_9LAMI